MGVVLYRKYRSRSFDEIVGQDHIVKTLQAALKNKKLSHAYLFTGPRGVGKTSVARILAHLVNGLDYRDGSMHLDIIEIDGASNRRIEEIRDLRDRVHIAPTSGEYKVYIIDEVHMLTKEAFNALLKTLEEPPAHCIFILATTEAHKLPETIISRTQRFNFQPVGTVEMSKHLESIAKKEKISVEPAAVRLLAEHGGGSFRDSISLLDQLGSGGQKVTEALVRDSLGLPKDSAVDALIESVDQANLPKVLENLDELRLAGIDPAQLAKELSRKLRNTLAEGKSQPWMTQLLKDLLEVSVSSQPQERLEIAVLEAASSRDQPPPPPTTPTEKAESRPVIAPVPTPSLSKEIKRPSSSGKQFNVNQWQEVLAIVKDKEPSLHMAIKMSLPKNDGHHLNLVFEYPLYKNKVDNSKSKKIIEDIISENFNSEVTVLCVTDKAAFAGSKATEHSPSSSIDNEQVKTISNIFGGGEVLESSVSN